METDFDANTMVAGFPLVKIKAALTWVGIMEDRDDVKNVADALLCHRPQASHVLEELEQQGYVTRSGKRGQWETTDRGRSLVFHWQPPRKLESAIEREDDDGAGHGTYHDSPRFILDP